MDSALMQGMSRVTEQKTDAETPLIEGVARGDWPALAALYDRYRMPLFRYLLQLTPDHGLAEELLQDTFVAVWKSAYTFNGRSSVQTWLFGIARRQAHNTLRRRSIQLALAGKLDGLLADGPEPEALLLAGIERDELARIVGLMPAVHREILFLIFVQELTYAESAVVLGVPIGTVKSRLSNAKRGVRILLSTDKEGEA